MQSLLGLTWGKHFVWLCQWTTLIGSTIGITLQAGLSMQVCLLPFGNWT